MTTKRRILPDSTLVRIMYIMLNLIKGTLSHKH